MEIAPRVYDILALCFIIWMLKSIKMKALKANGNRHFFQMKEISPPSFWSLYTSCFLFSTSMLKTLEVTIPLYTSKLMIRPFI